MLCARMLDLPCWPFELSLLNELYRRKLARSGMANSVNPDQTAASGAV